MGFFTQRHYHTFKANKKAFYSLWIFLGIFIISLNAEFIANDKPLYIRYDNQSYFPIFQSYPETTFGGDFESEANYNDPYLQDLIKQKGILIMPPIPYYYDTIIYTLTSPTNTSQSLLNPLGTDDLGRDVVARLLYGLKTSILFAFILTFFSSIIGLLIGAICGYF